MSENTNPLNKIEHIVVLMLENRSFDNLLGKLYDPANLPPFDKVPEGQSFEGTSGKDLSNPIPPDALEAERGFVPVGIENHFYNPYPDPGEEYYHVNTQMFNTVIPPENAQKPFDRKPYNSPPEPLPKPGMQGFVRDYINTFTGWFGRPPTYDEYSVIMNGFTPAQVPVLSMLAHSYAVCDHWFAATPSQTLPNRAFIHMATSHGYVINNPAYKWPLKSAPTIYNRLQDAGLSWKVYFDELDVIPGALMLCPAIWKYQEEHVWGMDHFFEDADKGDLPHYSFIEPRYFLDQNDMHPIVPGAGQQIALLPSTVTAGEKLVHEVYTALRTSPNWEQTLLVITFDEHGGIFDHVPPPPAPAPEKGAPKGEMDFRFNGLGIRVPAILVSPWIEEGTVLNHHYDHTSVLKTVETRWGLPPLTERDKAARDLSAALNRTEPREDDPVLEPLVHIPSPTKNSDAPFSGYQRAYLILATAVEGGRHIHRAARIWMKIKYFFGLLKAETKIAHVHTIGDAVKFLQDTFEPKKEE